MGDTASFEDKIFQGKPFVLCPVTEKQCGEFEPLEVFTQGSTEYNISTSEIEKGRIRVLAPNSQVIEWRYRGIRKKIAIEMKEEGATSFYLTIGMLEWNDGRQKFLAPLILYPVQLRQSAETVPSPVNF